MSQGSFMTALGHILLLAAFVASGWAAFACLVARGESARGLWRSGVAAAFVAVTALCAVAGILLWALLARDFGFKYVAHYSSQKLPWHYAVSAFWVGQAGSLLLWAWMLALLSLAFLRWPRQEAGQLRRPAFGVLMACLCLLVAVMVFGANPMEPSLDAPRDGAGLSPLLMHPAMLIHPPIVFLGYAGWAIPFALAMAALKTGRLDAKWIELSRPWALFSWLVLGCGILLGAEWAYVELGWGGYWGWDPVENGSLMPWLTGTVLIHATMVYQYRRGLKKTALALAIATFGLCNFATFLTRSGIFSSLHAFSQSPIGWIFLGGMLVFLFAGAILIAWRRRGLRPELQTTSLWTREALVMIAILALLLLTAVTFVGTLWAPLSGAIIGRTVVVGAAFYNQVLIPTGLLLLATTAMAPLLRWGRPPTRQQKHGLTVAGAASLAAVAVALAVGVRHPVALAVVAAAVMAVTTLGAAVAIDAVLQRPAKPWLGVLPALRNRRQLYAGFLIHLGMISLAVGITGTALGTRSHDVTLDEHETITWAGRTIRYLGVAKEHQGDKHVLEARLEITPRGGAPYVLRPAWHLHFPQDERTTEVAVHSTWQGDFYTVLHYARDDGAARLTFIENPLMRWLWLSGWIAAAGTVLRLWPAGIRRSQSDGQRISVPAPHRITAKIERKTRSHVH